TPAMVVCCGTLVLSRLMHFPWIYAADKKDIDEVEALQGERTADLEASEFVWILLISSMTHLNPWDEQQSHTSALHHRTTKKEKKRKAPRNNHIAWYDRQRSTHGSCRVLPIVLAGLESMQDKLGGRSPIRVDGFQTHFEANKKTDYPLGWPPGNGLQ